MMRTLKHLSIATLAAVALGACTTTGTGGGQVVASAGDVQPVAFSWISTDGGVSGDMTAILPGQTFQGRFFQITQQTRSDTLAPLWVHWHYGWYDWPYWGPSPGAPYPTSQFITHYSGKVVATLEAPNQERMRCRFHMVAPARGMSGGGEGQCQLTDGRVVRANFAAQ